MNNSGRNYMPKRQTRWLQLTIFSLLLIPLLPGSLTGVFAQDTSGRDKAVEHLRRVLEEPFLESGGFTEFDCSLTSGDKPEHPFTCAATDQSRKNYQYLLVPDPEVGVRVDLVTEPATQLDYEWLPAMKEHCSQFLQHLNAADWPAIFATLDPQSQNTISVAELEASLTPARELLGTLENPVLETYSARDGGRNELQYAVSAKNGPAAFRCGLNTNESGVTLLAFLVTPAAGTAVYRKWMDSILATQLSDSMDKEVSSLKIPYEQLPNVYDVAEGVGTLKNGDQFNFRVIRSGRLDDFNPLDYTIQVIEE